MIPAGHLTIALTTGVYGPALGVLVVILMGVFALVGVSAYIHRQRDMAAVDTEVEA